VIEFEGARVVVTGAGGGIGTTLCERFTRAGAQVVGCDLAGASFPDVCFETYEFDFLDRESLRNASSRILSYGTPSVVVLNAGWTSAASVSETTETELDGELTGNFTNPALFCQEILPAMRSSDGDRNFVFISSVNALTHFGNPAYSAAKAAGMAWIRALAVEEGRHGIRANSVVPATTHTDAWNKRLESDPGILDRLSKLYPLNRLVTPKEVANAALFLASPLASGITGSAITVDAGLSAGNLPTMEAIVASGG